VKECCLAENKEFLAEGLSFEENKRMNAKIEISLKFHRSFF
jgi:hypothetical protein